MARLLVSVSSVAEALAAWDGGADVVDTKDPRSGALGAVSDDVLGTIRDALPDDVPLSVALGDASDAETTRTRASAAARRRAAYVKVGFACAPAAAIATHLTVAREAATLAGAPTRVVAVAYADARRIEAAEPNAILDAAASSAAVGILLDTACKDSGGLFELWSREAVRDWIRRVRAANLLVALAGRLDLAAVARAASLGADIVGVRGAACDDGRLGRVSDARVRSLVDAAHG